MITCKLDVTKVDKSKLFAGKNGAKYLDIVLIESPSNQYGNDYMVVQSSTKEERAAGKRGVILGNGKILGRKNPQQEESTDSNEPPANEDKRIPF